MHSYCSTRPRILVYFRGCNTLRGVHASGNLGVMGSLVADLTRRSTETHSPNSPFVVLVTQGREQQTALEPRQIWN